MPLIQVLLHLESLPIPTGYSLGKLSFSPTKLDTPLEPTQLRLFKQCYLYFIYKGESVEWVLTHVVVLLLHNLTNCANLLSGGIIKNINIKLPTSGYFYNPTKYKFI